MNKNKMKIKKATEATDNFETTDFAVNACSSDENVFYDCYVFYSKITKLHW